MRGTRRIVRSRKGEIELQHLFMSANIKALMDELEKTIKIAEACGWQDVSKTTVLICRIMKEVVWGNPPSLSIGDFPSKKLVPDYFNSLDAMHDAEFDIRARLNHGEYSKALKEICFPVSITFSNACQRAEAFGKTLRLWD